MPRWKPTRSRSTPSSRGGECSRQGSTVPALERGDWAGLGWAGLSVLALPEPQCPNPEPLGGWRDGIFLLSNPILPSAGRALEAPVAASVSAAASQAVRPQHLLLFLALAVTADAASGLWAGGTGSRLLAAPTSSCASKREVWQLRGCTPSQSLGTFEDRFK